MSVLLCSTFKESPLSYHNHVSNYNYVSSPVDCYLSIFILDAILLPRATFEDEPKRFYYIISSRNLF